MKTESIFNVAGVLFVAAAVLYMVVRDPPVQQPSTARVKTQARIEAAQPIVGKTPEPRTYTINGHQLMVVDVPNMDSLGYVETQRCFVWRDAEFRTATLSCPAIQAPEPDILATGGPTYDNH